MPPRRVPHDGVWYFSAPWRTRKAPQTADAAWCTKESVRWVGPPTTRQGKVRCPDCGRRLTLMQVDIEHGYGDFDTYLPPHKVSAARREKARRVPPADTLLLPEPPPGKQPLPPVVKRLRPKERRALRRYRANLANRRKEDG